MILNQKKGGITMPVSLSSFLQWKFNVFMFKQLGMKAAYLYFVILGKLYFLINNKEKRRIAMAVGTVFANIKQHHEIKCITRDVFHGILFHYYEKIVNGFLTIKSLKTYFGRHVYPLGMDCLEKGLSRGKGSLMITGHLGGVEFIPGYLVSQGYPVSVVVKFKTETLRKISLQKADAAGFRIIDADTTTNIMKAITTNLKMNRIVITQCDEVDEWRPSPSRRIQFLGQNIYQDRTITVIAKRTRARVVFAFMHRNQFSGYSFIVTPFDQMTRCAPYSSDSTVGSVVIKFLERYIYRYPEEWYQWIKFPKIASFSTGEGLVETPENMPWLEPVIENPA